MRSALHDFFLRDLPGSQPSFEHKYWAAHYSTRLADVQDSEGPIDSLYALAAWQIEAAFDTDEGPFFPGA